MAAKGRILLVEDDKALVELLVYHFEREEFGVERTIQVLGATYGYSPALVLSQLAGALDGFTGKGDSEDDITAVCVRFK